MSNKPTVALTTLELERFTFAVQQEVTREARRFAIPARTSSQRDPLTENMVYLMEQDIWGKQLERVEERWPADWWQAVKEHFAPKLGRLGAWLLRRYPVRYHTLCVDMKALFPSIPDPGPERLYVHAVRDGVRIVP
jgi:hypothetical protein